MAWIETHLQEEEVDGSSAKKYQTLGVCGMVSSPIKEL